MGLLGVGYLPIMVHMRLQRSGPCTNYKELLPLIMGYENKKYLLVHSQHACAKELYRAIIHSPL